MDHPEKCQLIIKYFDITSSNQRCRSTILSAAGQGALKSMLLINGGASVAALAFIGSLCAKDAESKIMQITVNELLPLIMFFMRFYVWGTIAGAVSYGLVYLSEHFATGYLVAMESENMKKWLAKADIILDDKEKTVSIIPHYLAEGLNYLSWGLVAAGYVFFVIGSFNAIDIFTSYCH